MATYGTQYSDWLRQNQEALARADALEEPGPSPAAAPAPETTYQPPAAPAPVTAPTTRNAARALAEVRGQQVQAENETAASHLREGEAKAQSAAERAKTIGAATPRARRYADAADEVHAGNRSRQDRAHTWLEEDMKTLRDPPVEPAAWQKAVGILSGIVGATAQAYLGDVGGGLAYGMSALQDHVYQGVRNQLEAKDRAGKNLAHTEKYLDILGKDSADEADLAGKLAANHWFATSKELERMAEEAKVPEYRETSLRLAKVADDAGRDVLMKTYAEQVAKEERAKAAAAAARAKKQLTPKEILELEKLRLANEGSELANAKARGELAGGGKGQLEVFPGYTQTRPLSAGPEQKATTIYSSGASIKADLARLAEMRERNGGGTWNRNDVKEARAIMQTLPSRYSQMFGSGAPNNTELELFGSFLVDPTDYQLTGLDVNESYRRLAEQVDRTAEAQLAGFGINKLPTAPPPGPDIRARGEAAAAAPDPNAPVRMINMKNGRVYDIPASRVEAAKAQGLEVARGATYDEPKPAPKPVPATPARPQTVAEVYAKTPAELEEDARFAAADELLRQQRQQAGM